MAVTLASNEFIDHARAHLVVDVRTPAEFAQGHFPGAINIPLFTDAERVEVGTCYKNLGRDPAIQLGLRLVGPKLAGLSASLQAAAARSNNHLLVHCWRGGMRSASMAWLAELGGARVSTLAGGYKAFRRWVLDVNLTARAVHVVSGFTGSGKTDVLHAMVDHGATVIDLEALAHHKGSVFGDLGEEPQPTQEQFENNLLLAWRATDPTRPVWVEDESRTIGRCHIPAAIWAEMRAGRRHEIILPAAVRITRLRDTYTHSPADLLVARVEAIRKRLGGDRADLAIQAIRDGDMDSACTIALAYYDRTYRNCLALLPAPPVASHVFTGFDASQIACTLLASSTV